MWPIITSIGIVAAGLSCAAAFRYAQHAKLKRERAGESFETFLRHFSNDQVSEPLCFIVYHYLQGLLAIRNFPVLPEDDLSEVYGVGEFMGVGFDDVIEDLSEKLGIEEPSDSEFRLIAAEIGSMNKVKDIVRLFSRLLQRQTGQM